MCLIRLAPRKSFSNLTRCAKFSILRILLSPNSSTRNSKLLSKLCKYENSSIFYSNPIVYLNLGNTIVHKVERAQLGQLVNAADLGESVEREVEDLQVDQRVQSLDRLNLQFAYAYQIQ